MDFYTLLFAAVVFFWPLLRKKTADYVKGKGTDNVTWKFFSIEELKSGETSSVT